MRSILAGFEKWMDDVREEMDEREEREGRKKEEERKERRRRERKERKGRNPSTGEEITIPASFVPSFKAGKTLKDAVSK